MKITYHTKIVSSNPVIVYRCKCCRKKLINRSVEMLELDRVFWIFCSPKCRKQWLATNVIVTNSENLGYVRKRGLVERLKQDLDLV